MEKENKEPEMGYVVRDGKLIHKSKMVLDYPAKNFNIPTENIPAKQGVSSN